MTRPDHDYLWDGTGPADADVARLERALGGLRHAGAPPPLPDRAPAPRRRRWLTVSIAASLAAAAARPRRAPGATATASTPSRASPVAAIA